jgi:hypothetical protein
VAFGSGGSDRSPGPDEIVEFGTGRSRWRGWLTGLLVAGLAAALLVKAAGHPGRDHPPAARPPVAVTSTGHRLLGVTAGWELFGLGQHGIVSVQFARGRITRTTLPPPEGGGPESLIVGPHQAIVRPLDGVPGYLVPDGEPPRPLTGRLAGGGLLLPGPQPGDEWLVSGGANSLTLLGPGGRPASPSADHIVLPADRWVALSAMSDGRGNMLVSSVSGGQYDVSPAAVRHVGALLDAVGAARWLGVSCTKAACQNVVIDPATGGRRILPGPALQLLTWPWPYEPGAVAPDGRTAAVVVGTGGEGVGLTEVNLVTGTTARIGVPVSQDTSSQTMVWSPDSAWLFVVAADGRLVAVSAASRRVVSLGVPLPVFSQLAIRPAS